MVEALCASVCGAGQPAVTLCTLDREVLLKSYRDDAYHAAWVPMCSLRRCSWRARVRPAWMSQSGCSLVRVSARRYHDARGIVKRCGASDIAGHVRIGHMALLHAGRAGMHA